MRLLSSTFFHVRVDSRTIPLGYVTVSLPLSSFSVMVGISRG